MLLKFSEELIHDLQLLNQISEDQLQSTLKFIFEECLPATQTKFLSLEFQFSTYEESHSEIENTILRSLYFLYITCIRNKLSKEEFLISVQDAQVPHSHTSLMQQFYEQYQAIIREYLLKMEAQNRSTATQQDVNTYRNLNWRLDIEMDGRTLRYPKPVVKYLLEIETQNENKVLLQVQYQDLVHICSTLETALKEINSVHVRRMKTYI